MGYSSFSVCGGSVVLVLRGVEGVPESWMLGTGAPSFGDVALLSV